MEEFKKSLYEVYMNYDTLKYLKEEEKETNEDIVSMFEEEVGYSKDLIDTLLSYDKSFLKSIAMRIKLKMKKNIDNKSIKDEILSYDTSLGPLIEKLIKSESFKKEYSSIMTEVKEVENEEVDEVHEDSYSDIEESETNNINLFIENCVELTGNKNDIIKVSDLYKAYCEYCDSNEIEKEAKPEFKEWIAERWGKSPKNGYEGYSLK